MKAVKFAGYDIKSNVSHAKSKLGILHSLTTLICIFSIVMSWSITTEVVIFYVATMFYKYLSLLFLENRQKEERKEEIDEINRARTTSEVACIPYSRYFVTVSVVLTVLFLVIVLIIISILENRQTGQLDIILQLMYRIIVTAGILWDAVSNFISNIVLVSGGERTICRN